MRVDHLLMRGSVDKKLRLTYQYEYRNDGEFKTVHTRESGDISIMPSYALKMSHGWDEQVFIPSVRYFPFVSLLEKSTALISEHLYEIFPNVDRTEFDIDKRTLERFQTERAMTTSGMRIIPCVWVNEMSECFPGLQFEDTKMIFRFPLEDAIAMVRLLSRFDPVTFGLLILNML